MTIRIIIGIVIIIVLIAALSVIFIDIGFLVWTVKNLIGLLIISSVIIFQPEIRRMIADIMRHPFFTSASEKRETIEELTETVFTIASKGFGALIAIERGISLRQFIETGVLLDADYSNELVLTIFHPKTVLHDGGLIIQNDRLVAAACIFPLSQREDLDRNLGLRHRAALGLSEQSDTVTIVVSEETGQVSICHTGILERNMNEDKFRRRLSKLLLNNDESETEAAKS